MLIVRHFYWELQILQILPRKPRVFIDQKSDLLLAVLSHLSAILMESTDCFSFDLITEFPFEEHSVSVLIHLILYYF